MGEVLLSPLSLSRLLSSFQAITRVNRIFSSALQILYGMISGLEKKVGTNLVRIFFS